VGKSSGVGAHVVLPNVRGDKVLWMCGGHHAHEANLFDSAGVQPSTKGEIEPCDLSVRAATQFDGRFVHLRMILKRLDDLIYNGMKESCTQLQGVSSRSDCMLACYQEGDRFQKHIDNTANDGRRLTCLVYLNNPDSSSSSSSSSVSSLANMGGALRLHQCGEDKQQTIDLLPKGGRLVMFWSDQIQHEVLEQLKNERIAITVWYFDFGERMRAVMKASSENKQDIGGGDVQESSSQREAQAFVEQLLEGSSEVKSDTKRLSILHRTAQALTPVALCILARVFFGKTVQATDGNGGGGGGGGGVTPETIRASLIGLELNQYLELRKQAREMHAGRK
jgi:hypothetical protein